MSIDKTYSASLIEDQYEKWKNAPDSVSKEWRFFFEGFELGRGSEGIAGATEASSVPSKHASVERLLYRYRDIGHLLACLDPLTVCPTSHPLLDLSQFGLDPSNLNQRIPNRFKGLEQATLQELITALKETYCRSIGVEYLHLQDPTERKWLQERMEKNRNRPNLGKDAQIRIFQRLHHAALFESLLNKKYPAQTRFSLEGAEALISTLDALVLHAAGQGCSDIVYGMAHRGRLNVLVNILQKSYLEVFQEFSNSYDPDSIVGAGDVKYHNGYLSEVTLPGNRKVRMSLINNPSHLESVDPVMEGVARGLQELRDQQTKSRVLPVLIHGDAAFAGQGVVMETLNFSQLEGYETQGTIHIVINNQIGYTTLPENARSTRYSTDVAKMLMIPIFHVHGENPEALVHVVKLAYDYRLAFKKDVVIDFVCYRRHGHNEGDEPYFTQPDMYQRIKSRPPIHKLYAEELVQAGIINQEDGEKISAETNQCLEDQFAAEQTSDRVYTKPRFYDVWGDYTAEYSHKIVKTGVNKKNLVALGGKLSEAPEGFMVHPKLVRILKKRWDSIQKGENIDWANGEALAFATLAAEGKHVRLSGQDCARGTFSQRHALLFDHKTGDPYSPIESVAKDAGRFEVFNSPLSETGILGFEYGYTMVQPDRLVMWEAQFGDFVNSAQTIIDLYIAAGESKWQRLSGLVMLLPHGFEGMGPEHSSARLERFLQLCADNNLIVAYPTTPAQYFHLLRRQVHARYRKPLIVMTPKSLLRNPLAVSKISDFTVGGFKEIIIDPLPKGKIKRVIFTSGKLYYELQQAIVQNKVKNIALVRMEQFYPFPEDLLRQFISKNKSVKDWCWVQEEPRNMGGYRFVKERLEELSGNPLQYIGRADSSSPATGFVNIFRKQQADIIEQAVNTNRRG
jgi:2-oxoglutarate dehydrogenase E1 component